MKITILDRATIGTDIKVSQLLKYGEVVTFDVTKPDKTIERITNSDIVITNKVVIGENELKAARNLKLICVAATGYNNIDVATANEYGVIVTNVKGYSTESVAQYVFSHILAFSNSIFEFQNQIKQNYWQKSSIFTSLDFPINELSGKNIGIIGYGNIGKRVAEIAKVFGMKILISKRKNDKQENAERVDFETVLKESDFLSIHCPLNEETKNLITEKEFNLMKKSAVLINAARGGIVNETDLFNALKTEKIRGAIVDVITKEPPSEGNILFNAPNILITPHIAWTSKEARIKLFEGIVYNIQAYKDGKGEEIKIQ